MYPLRNNSGLSIQFCLITPNTVRLKGKVTTEMRAGAQVCLQVKGPDSNQT